MPHVSTVSERPYDEEEERKMSNGPKPKVSSRGSRDKKGGFEGEECKDTPPELLLPDVIEEEDIELNLTETDNWSVEGQKGRTRSRAS